MAIHRVLIERDEHVDLVAHVAHGRIARANGQECMPTTDDRLIGVVSIEMEPAPREDAGENVPGGGDALAVLATNADCEIYFGRLCHQISEPCNLPVGAGLSKPKLKQKSADRGQRTEIRDQRSEIGDQRSEIGGRRSEVRSRKVEGPPLVVVFVVVLAVFVVTMTVMFAAMAVLASLVVPAFVAILLI